ncbi:MAG TPA: cell division protein FtsA [Candidatus Babeliales bacterium]|jgi:cell division protein FtsA|nr:cell division protein FtsA [Candidatus Babeliales bacterium]
MTKVLSDEIITSIDVGTTKISVFIARRLEGIQCDIIGIGTVPSYGLQKGVVVDVPKAIRSISQAIKEAELMAGVTIEDAYVGISGAHIHAITSQGMVPIMHGAVTEAEVKSVLSAAQTIMIPEGQQIIQVLPQYFILDGKDRVLDPVGMHGIRLEVQVHIILGSIFSVQNLITCCQKAGIQVRDIILEHIASAAAVLSNDERELGVGVLDIGGGTSDFAVYHKSSIRHTKVIPVAGNHFTHDIAIGLRTTVYDAERVKCMYGIALLDQATEPFSIEVARVQGDIMQTIIQSDLVRIIQPRAIELMRLLKTEIVEHELKSYMATGLVLTGGGSLLGSLDTITERIVGLPVRIGKPHTMFEMPPTIRTPLYATGYGILIHILKGHAEKQLHNAKNPLYMRIADRMQRWMKEFF